MLPIAGQTAGPNGLKFVVVGVCQLFKKKKKISTGNTGPFS